jgi:hypothetical protein
MGDSYYRDLMSKPDFKLRVDACRLGLPFEQAFTAPSDFIAAWLAAAKA